MKPNYSLMVGMATIGLFLSTAAPCQIPVIGNYNVYYGSLHNHTSVSDGTGTPDQAYKYARDVAGLDFFGLADHSNLMSSTEWTTIKNAANANNSDGTFAAFYGFEWTTYLSYGHVAIVGTEDYCSTGTATSTFTKLLTWLNARSGIAFFNHPGWDWSAFNEFNHFTGTPSDKFVGMELWNDNDGFSKYYYNDGYYSNDGSKGYFDEALARGWKIGAAGADDNHDADWGTSTPYRIGVLADNLTRSDIMNAFKARRIFSTLDKNISLSFKINGAEMGSVIPGGNLNFLIQAKDGDNETFNQVVLMKNGAQLKSWNFINSLPMISEYFTCANGDYFYVRIKQTDGGEAISSPIFIFGTSNLPPSVSVTSPVSGTSFAEGATIPITASATDTDGTIDHVEFYAGTTLLGSDNTSPYEYSWAPVGGSYTLTAKAFDNSGASTVSAPVAITVTSVLPVTTTSAVSTGNDDAEQYSGGKMVLNSDDIDLVYDNLTSGNQTVGLYFRNLNIPAGATIVRASIQFTCYRKTTNTCSLVIRGEKVSVPAAFTTTSKNLSSRTKTTASVTWNPSGWTTAGSKGTAQQTPDLKTVVQEIAGLSAGTTGNLVILITGSGTRTAYSFETAPANAAVLTVEYSPASAQNQEVLKKGEVTVSEPAPGSRETLQEPDITLYPNPVNDVLNIRVTGNAVLEQIDIYSVNSVLVAQRKISGALQEAEFDCRDLVPGTYVVLVKTSNGDKTLKFLRQ